MKKYLVLCAVIGSSTAAMAQSSVTIFGVIDAGVARASATGGGHAIGLASGGNTTPRLGFRGTEDLGGGLAASFWLEGQLSNDVGGAASQTTGLDFARRSTLSLSSTYGEIRLGRDLTPTYLNMFFFDTWGQRGLGTIGNFGFTAGGLNNYFRNSNSVSYFLPANLGGFYGTVQYAFGERSSTSTAVVNAAGVSSSAANAATDKTGNYLGGRLGYASGPLDVAVAYGRSADSVRTTGIAAAPFYAGDYNIGNLGASYDFGVVKAILFAQQEKIGGRGAAPDFKFNTYSLGATAPLGVGVLRAQLVRYDNKSTNVAGDDATQLSLGYVYNLSKRTALYADIARLNNKGNAVYTVSTMSGSFGAPVPTAGGNSTGYMVGVKHAF